MNEKDVRSIRYKDGNSKKLWNIDKVAEHLDVPKGWIYQRTRDRSPSTIPFYKVGKYLRFDPDEVQAWLEAQHRGWQTER
jgi:excisionase family DNA binding protein